jgi:hypothetical protein
MTTLSAFGIKNNIPIVGVTETMPNNMQINIWLMNEINATNKALSQNK